MGTWAIEGTATCISKRARVIRRISSLVANKASPSSLTPTALAQKTDWPATLAGYPSTAAVAKPFGCRGSSSQTPVVLCMMVNLLLLCNTLVHIESSGCSADLAIARATWHTELSISTTLACTLFAMHVEEELLQPGGFATAAVLG